MTGRLALFAAMSAAGLSAFAANLFPGGDFTKASGKLGALAFANGGRVSLFQEESTWNKCGALEVLGPVTNGNGSLTWSAVALVGSSDGRERGMAVKGGRTYDFKVELRADRDVRAGISLFAWNEGPWKDAQCVKTTLSPVKVPTTWTQFGGSFKVPEGKTRATLQIQLWASAKQPPAAIRTGDRIYFDNVVVTEAEDGFAALAAQGGAFLESVWEPRVVAVPPTAAVRDMCVTADGEIRHYGWQMVGGEKRRVFIASRDCGMNWQTHLADADDAGAMTRSPWSGEWISFRQKPGGRTMQLLRSKKGPGDTSPDVTDLPWERQECRQLVAMKSRRRWVACFSDIRCLKGQCYNAAVALSDDDGLTWRYVEIPCVEDVPRLQPGDARVRWFNNGCEPTVVEHSDGSLELAVRTSGERHRFFKSADGGETWVGPVDRPEFWASNTMPLFFRLSDGRLLFFWNNTSPLPTRHESEYPELTESEREGVWESVFTNRDALHAAISDDDGRTWRGFREIILNPIRNAPDFRERGNDPAQEKDKSVHQTQALELPGGKVLLALGQGAASRRIVAFDPDWLCETSRAEDFKAGLANVSTHLFVRSLSGGFRGWSGHCAWNRVPGALLVREPDTGPDTTREALQLCRIPDPRLVSDRQGVVWNFPAARRGRVCVECRIEGEGFELTLADHWMNPCDEYGPTRSPLSVPVTARDVPPGSWRNVVAEWDADAGKAVVLCDGRPFCEVRFKADSPSGVSYLHLQSLAKGLDPKGTYFRSFTMKSGVRD